MLEVVLIVARGRGEGAGKPQPDGVYSVAAAAFAVRSAPDARRTHTAHTELPHGTYVRGQASTPDLRLQAGWVAL